MKTSSKARGRGRNRSQGSRNAGALSHPPQIHPSVSGSKTFRFQAANSVASVAVTSGRLLDLLVMAGSAITSFLLFSSIRLRKIEIWGAPAQGGVAEVCRVEGTGPGPENVKSDISMGVTPAHVHWNPHPDSVTTLWQNANGSSNSSLALITAPQYAVVDVTIDYIMDFLSGDVTAGPTPAGATPGQFYGTTLDGNGLTGSLVPSDYVQLP